MGYRRAAKMRRTQYVSGHYRTSKNGKTFWVEGHMRNDRPDYKGFFPALGLSLFIPALCVAALVHPYLVAVLVIAGGVYSYRELLKDYYSAQKRATGKQTDEACGDLHALIGSESKDPG